MKIPVNPNSVQLNPLSGFPEQSTYVRPASVFGAVAGALGEISDAQEHLDNLRAEEALNQARAAQIKLREEAGRERGANVLPRDGKGFTDTYLNRFDDDISKVKSGLTNGRQKAMFEQRAGVLRQTFGADVQAHEARESRAHADEVDANTVALETDNAKANVGNLRELTLGRIRIEGAIDSLATRNGWSDEKLSVERTKALSGFHGGVIGAALDAGSLDVAKDYFGRNKSEIDPDMRDKIQTAITQKESVLTVDAKADAIWKVLGPKNDKEPVQLDKLMEQVRQEENPDIRKALEAEIKDRAHAFDYSVKQRTDATVSTLFQDIEKGSSWKQIKNDPKFMDLDGKTQNALRKHYEDERGITRDGSGGVPPNAGQEYWNLVENPDKLKSMSVDQIFAMTPRIGKGYREELLKRREKLLKPGEADKVTIDQNLLTTEYRKALNLKPDRKLSEGDKTMLAELEVKMQQIQQGSGVKWSMENSAKLAQELMRPVVTEKGWLKDKTQPLFKAMEQVPASYVQAVRAKAAAKGLNPSDEQIMRAYFADKEKGLVD